MVTEFSVGEFTYAITRPLNAFVQDKLIRRLSPAMAGIAPALVDIATKVAGKSIDDLSLGDLLQKDVLGDLGPVAKALASVPDVDADFIFSTCLGVVSRQKAGGTGWAPVMSSGGLMFEDIGLGEMYRLTWHVLQENLGPFFASFGLTIRQPTQADPAPIS